MREDDFKCLAHVFCFRATSKNALRAARRSWWEEVPKKDLRNVTGVQTPESPGHPVRDVVRSKLGSTRKTEETRAFEQTKRRRCDRDEIDQADPKKDAKSRINSNSSRCSAVLTPRVRTVQTETEKIEEFEWIESESEQLAKAEQQTVEASAEPSIKSNRFDWRQGCFLEVKEGITELAISFASWNVTDIDISNWISWMKSQFSRGRWKITNLNFSNNQLTSVGISNICDFLRLTKATCENWNFEGNQIADDGFLSVCYHVASETGSAASLNFANNAITMTGLSWLFNILSWHPMHPLQKSAKGGATFYPMKVRLDSVKIDSAQLDAFFDSNQFKFLCCSVYVGCSYRQRVGATARSNVVVQLEMGPGFEMKRIMNEFSMLRLTPQCQVHRSPTTSRTRWFQVNAQHWRTALLGR